MIWQKSLFHRTKQDSMMQRVNDAIKILRKSFDQLARLLKYQELSLDIVCFGISDSSDLPHEAPAYTSTQLFQLRMAEQNELAILADLNDRVILVFTVVTIVFHPLSFFAPYFGANVRGIVDTDKTKRYLWAVYGSTTISVASAIELRERLSRRLWTA